MFIRLLMGIRMWNRNSMTTFEEFEEGFEFHNKGSPLKGATVSESLYQACIILK